MQLITRQAKQQGFFLIIAVVFILVMGVMGTLIAYLLANRANVSVAEQMGLKTFYNAESGLEAGARLLSIPALSGTPSRITCAAVTGTSAITNASLNGGTFTVSTINSSPIRATNSLSSSETATDTVINTTSTTGFASSGRIIIDNEAIDYAAISGNTFIGATRGVDGTLASSHASGAGIGQYQCSLDSQAGIPTIASPSYKRQLQWNVELPEAWAVAAVASNNFITTHWNYPTEKTWTAGSLAGGSSAAAMNGVSMLSNADGWAVGNSANNSFTFLHWTGSSWVSVPLASACEENLTGVSMVSSQDGYAVGVRWRVTNCNSGNYVSLIMHWNGTNWSELTSPTVPTSSSASAIQNLNAVSVIDTAGTGVGNFGFAVANNGDIIQYNGSTWTIVTSPVSNNLFGVSTVSASEAWAVGAGGRILKWNGSNWSSVTSPVSNALNAIAMLDTNGDGLAEFGVAAGASGKILTYDGSAWSESVDIGGTALNAVTIVNSKDAWVAGAGGTIYHYDGSTWTSVASNISQAINGISSVAAKKQPTSGWKQVFR